MSYSKTAYDAVEPLAPGMHFLRDPLNCETLGVTVIEGSPEWKGLEHDHAEDGQEEVYLLVEGAGTLEINGESVELTPGVAVRVAPAATRQLSFHEDSLVVVAGAT